MRIVPLRLYPAFPATFGWALFTILAITTITSAQADLGSSPPVSPLLASPMRMPSHALFPLLGLPRVQVPSAAAVSPTMPAQRPAGSGMWMTMPRPMPQMPLDPNQSGALPRPALRMRQAGGASPGQECRRAIANAERMAGIPDHLLAAIAHVESGRRDPQTGVVDPWPWSINVEGTDHIYDTEAEVIAAVRTFQSEGRRSIDVGCLQVNLMYHPDAFTSLEQAFDPRANAEYAAKFLTELYRQTGTWPHATANYHSASPDLGGDYARKVMAVLPEEQQGAPSPGPMTISPAPTMSTANVIPMPGIGARMVTGRSLDSYRNNPIRLARR